MRYKGLHNFHPHLPFKLSALCPGPSALFFFFFKDLTTLCEIGLNSDFNCSQSEVPGQKNCLRVLMTLFFLSNAGGIGVSAALCLKAGPSGVLGSCTPE